MQGSGMEGSFIVRMRERVGTKLLASPGWMRLRSCQHMALCQVATYVRGVDNCNFCREKPPVEPNLEDVFVLFIASLRTSHSISDRTGVLGSSYNETVTRRTNRSEWHLVPLPAVVFALCFILLGWIAG